METTNTLQLKCPKCKKMNTVEMSSPITCHHCKETLTNKKSKNMLAVVVVAAAIGLGAGHTLDDSFEPNRYPVEDELAIIEQCASTRSGMYGYQYQEKRQACSCALIETQKVYDYESFKENQMQFLTEFKEHVMQCSK